MCVSSANRIVYTFGYRVWVLPNPNPKAASSAAEHKDFEEKDFEEKYFEEKPDILDSSKFLTCSIGSSPNQVTTR